MYKSISPSSDPKEIGINNGIYQVELLEKKSFVSNDEKKYYQEYFNGNVKSFLLDNFKNIKKSKLSLLTYYPLKKAKETDFISFSPNELGLNFIVSQKVIDIFESFNLSDFIKIPSKIEGFINNYYTIGFPITNYKDLDFSKSVFCDYQGNQKLINTYEEYDEKRYDLKIKKLKLINKINSNIIYSQIDGLFFSIELIEKLGQHNITGFQIRNTELE